MVIETFDFLTEASFNSSFLSYSSVFDRGEGTFRFAVKDESIFKFDIIYVLRIDVQMKTALMQMSGIDILHSGATLKAVLSYHTDTFQVLNL